VGARGRSRRDADCGAAAVEWLAGARLGQLVGPGLAQDGAGASGCLLRFCRLVLEQGFTFLAAPIMAACAIYKTEELARTHRWVHVTYSSLKLVVFFGLFYSAVSIICAGYTTDVPAACETQLRNAWLKIPERFWDLIEHRTLPVAWLAVALIIWRFDTDWNAVPVDFGAEQI